MDRGLDDNAHQLGTKSYFINQPWGHVESVLLINTLQTMHKTNKAELVICKQTVLDATLNLFKLNKVEKTQTPLTLISKHKFIERE